MDSAIRRLLDELSWEGNAKKYRNGGIGLENVLTTEVFQALDFLPRPAFMGAVLNAAVGAERPASLAAACAEECTVDILPGDLRHPHLDVRAQPDVLISSQDTYVFVEAKRIRSSSFQPEQIARELLLMEHFADGRDSLLLLVLGSPPPIHVRGNGRMTMAAAAEFGAQVLAERLGREIALPNPNDHIAYVTWAGISAAVEAGLALEPTDASRASSVRRLAMSLTDAIKVHS